MYCMQCWPSSAFYPPADAPQGKRWVILLQRSNECGIEGKAWELLKWALNPM